MALKSRRYGCPDCQGEFTILLDDRDQPPSHCPLCGAYVGADPEPIPYFSRIGRQENQGQDKTFRMMEKASYERAEQAASDLNVPVSEVASIRMTNMKDNIREGDTSFIAPVTPKISAPQNLTGGQVGLATAQMIKASGGSTGQSFMDTVIRPKHKMAEMAVARNGNVGAYLRGG